MGFVNFEIFKITALVFPRAGLHQTFTEMNAESAKRTRKSGGSASMHPQHQ